MLYTQTSGDVMTTGSPALLWNLIGTKHQISVHLSYYSYRDLKGIRKRLLLDAVCFVSQCKINKEPQPKRPKNKRKYLKKICNKFNKRSSALIWRASVWGEIIICCVKINKTKTTDWFLHISNETGSRKASSRSEKPILRRPFLNWRTKTPKIQNKEMHDSIKAFTCNEAHQIYYK